ncbi:MAG: hypothetical protein EAZ09_14310 [Oscillatoriales cyanobacterium]|nr:MAG: hypothetical protein EAZ18_12365 [Oscillatoriales cyanobacterium]TAH20455.1 MAG: hypothetical protein EAZ09_14310 [Oscillatoriales cyanobacterium]
MIAIVLLISRKPACHTVKTYAYPVIQQGRKRVGIARNLPASLFFRRKKEEGRKKKEEARRRLINAQYPMPHAQFRFIVFIQLKSNSKFKELLRNN